MNYLDVSNRAVEGHINRLKRLNRNQILGDLTVLCIVYLLRKKSPSLIHFNWNES